MAKEQQEKVKVASPKKVAALKTRYWSQVNVQNRNVAEKLNELSASGHTIFTVNQSIGIGGVYEVLYYIDKSPIDPYFIQTLPPVTNNGVEVAIAHAEE